MIAHSAPNRGVFRVAALAVAVVALFLVPATSAFADPGAPGLDRPATSVYLQGDERPVLGEENTGGAGDRPEGLGGASLGGGNSGSDESLPFTGFAAALVLGGGLTLLLLGIAMRVGTHRLRHAES